MASWFIYRIMHYEWVTGLSPLKEWAFHFATIIDKDLRLGEPREPLQQYIVSLKPLNRSGDKDITMWKREGNSDFSVKAAYFANQFSAEMWGVAQGLKLAFSLGLSNVIVALTRGLQ
ncbi:hypothetical protein VNO78_08034 [Psophocarpus tetragonolobus]|uniref:Uncharacterized protein n=1 Tax=Psophocarpus tetragonolobus TaxID=3891 RepID=A0AAN9SVA8_PSOTE